MAQREIFKVVRILDEYRIVINAGINNKITDCCYFKIIGSHDEIIDPDTSESLGTLPCVKELVKPVIIERKFCVCEHFDSRLLKDEETIVDNAMLFTNSRKLNVNKEQVSNFGISEPINLGDKAVLMVMSHDIAEDKSQRQVLHKKVMGLS